MWGCRRTNLRCKDKTWRQSHKASTNVLQGFPCSPLTQPLGCFLEATINHIGELPHAARIWTVLILCNLGLQEIGLVLTLTLNTMCWWWKVGMLFELWAFLAAKVTCSTPESSRRSLMCSLTSAWTRVAKTWDWHLCTSFFIRYVCTSMWSQQGSLARRQPLVLREKLFRPQ